MAKNWSFWSIVWKVVYLKNSWYICEHYGSNYYQIWVESVWKTIDLSVKTLKIATMGQILKNPVRIFLFEFFEPFRNSHSIATITRTSTLQNKKLALQVNHDQLVLKSHSCQFDNKISLFSIDRSKSSKKEMNWWSRQIYHSSGPNLITKHVKSSTFH
jgi:hypothetical protein